jgi:hypothetical protein
MYLSCGSPTTILPRDRMLEAGYEVSIQPHYSRRPIDVAYYRREIEAKSLEEMADLWFGEKAFIDSLNLVGLWRRIAAKEGQSE